MLDLKYSMQHLLARMLHKTNPKASLKAVDGMIQDVEAYVPYCFSKDVMLIILDTAMLHGNTHSVSFELLSHCRLHRIKIPSRRCSISTKLQPWLAVMEIRLCQRWQLSLNP